MKKRFYLFGEGSKINQIICAILINIPVFGYGTSIGWMSPMALLLQSKDSPRGEPYTDSEVSWMASIPFLMSIPANLMMAYLGDKIGRKTTLLFMSLVGVIIWTLKLISYQPWVLILARALVGISMAGSYVTSPVYTKDIAEDSIRGILGSSIILFHTCGNLFAYIIGDYLSYRVILYICLFIPLLHLPLLVTMPESPSFLVKKGKDEEAVRVIAWLRCRNENDPAVKQELDDIKKEHKNDNEGSKFILKAIFKDKILLRAFRIAILISVARELCGAVTVLNFAGDIFAMASIESGPFLSPNQQAMTMGAVQVFGAIVASSVVEKAGRKPLLIVTSLISGVSMCSLASWFLARQFQVYGLNWLPITSICICIFCDAAGLLPLSVVIAGEIFSFKYRGTVLATAMSISAIGDFLHLILFKPMVNTIGAHSVFYFCSLVFLANALYAVMVLPETKLRRLDEIYDDLKTKKERKLEISSLNNIVTRL